MNIIFLLIMYTQAILKEEQYEYQVGLILTQQKEDFILLKTNPNNINFQNVGSKIHDEKVVLISETNHKMDKVIDIKQNEYEIDDFVWILYEIDDPSILSKQSINDLLQKENYYLQLNFECYKFHFISKSEIIIDCQDQISNIIVLYNIQSNLQQSFFYSYYREVKLRKLLITSSSNVLVLIQQNKYSICNQLTFENNAHEAHIQDNQITLISDYWIDVFEVVIANANKIVHLQRQFFNNIQFQPNHQLLHYFCNPFNKYQYFVYQTSLITCIQNCVTIQLDGEPRKIDVLKNYFIIQTNYSIQIVYLTNGENFKIKHMYNNDYVLMNKVLHEVLLLNTEQLKFYGLAQNPYLRIKNQRQLILIDNSYYYYKNQIYDQGEDSILFDERFKFKVFFNFPVNQNAFVVIGGAMNVTFYVEDSLKEQIKIRQSYFIHNFYSDVQYYFFGLDERQNEILHTINGEQFIFCHDISILQKQSKTLIKKNITANLTDFIDVLSFNDAYYLKNQSNGQYFVMRLQMSNINLIQFQCLQDSKLALCNSILCVCQSKNEIYVKLLDRDPGIHIQKLEQEQYLYLDYANDVKMVCLKNNSHLNIKYFYGTNFFQPIIHTQTLKLCNNFINLVIFQIKLILVCQDEIILYNKLSNYRYAISGNVELYGEQFEKSSLVIQSNEYLYYIIDNQKLYVFNSILALEQQYVTKMQIDKYTDVKTHNKHICFKYQHNLQCFYYQINIKFSYDNDNVEYHQAFKVNVCAENKYNKKCKQYITRLDQQNRRISIHKKIYQLIINQNTKKIILDNQFFSGSVDKIYVNNLQLKPKQQVQAYIQIVSDRTHKSYYNGFGNQIYILNNQTLTIYNIETRKIKNLSTRNRMFFILKHKYNIILFGPYSITVINCEFECKEMQYLEEKIPLQGFLQVINNTLYSIGLGLLRTYDLDDLSQNKSVQQIDEQSSFYQIDIQEDKMGQICMVYLSYDGKLVFKYQNNSKWYYILELLKQIGMQLEWSNPDAVYSAKILDDCRIVFLSTVAGYFFLELSEDIILRAQIVVQDQKPYRQGQLLIGKSYLFYTQVLLDSVAIYKFTYAEIYESKFIDFCKKLYKLNINYKQNEDYFYAYKDELYYVQQSLHEYVINKIDLDTEIEVGREISSKYNMLVELSNQDEKKSFIIELLVEEEDHHLLFSTVSGFLIIFYIILIYFKLSKRAQQIF